MLSANDLLKTFSDPEVVGNTRDSILIIDDDTSIQRGLQRYFKFKYNVISAESGAQGIDALLKSEVHCIILDIKMNGQSGFDVYPRLKETVPGIPIVFYTGFQDDHDIKLILNKYNPQGYFGKGENILAIESTIEKAVKAYKQVLDEKKLKEDLKNDIEQRKKYTSLLKKQLQSRYQPDALKGVSPKMAALKEMCKKAMHSDITVLIHGETGTGKELVANIIHANSRRADKDLFIQNCAAIPDHLFESEFFGHKKGSFTGAISNKKGLFEMADRGCVFLDEIGDLSFPMQAKLLRLLQEGEIKPVGSNTKKYIDVRLISATNKSLLNEVREGRFREDLYYRLNVFTISPPPLREIKEDIPLLARFLLEKYNQKYKTSINSISDDALSALMNYPFPGNVRELENEIERAMVMVGSSGKIIELCHFSEHMVTHAKQSAEYHGPGKTLKEQVSMFEKKIIQEALEQHNGNKTITSRALGISRVGLNNKIKRYHIR